MDLAPIADLGDPRLAPYRDLNRSNLTRQSGLFVVESELLVRRLVASRFPVESVLVDEHRVALVPSDLPPDVPVYVIPRGCVERIVGFNFHRGVLACGRRVSQPIDLARIVEGKPACILVFCVDIHDPTNLGVILRNCAAFGADAVVTTPRCADWLSRRVVRVSMGASLSLPVIESLDVHRELDRCRDEFHCQCIASVLDSRAENLEECSRPPRVVLLFGNEGHGLPAETVARCERRVTIPMAGTTDSLNAAVASGIFLYHFARMASTLSRPD